MAVGYEFQTFVSIWSITKELEAEIDTEYRRAAGVRLMPWDWTPVPVNRNALQQLKTVCEAAKANNQLKYFAKGSVIMRNSVPGWQLVADGADMEFVTDHVSISAEKADADAFPGEDTLLAQMDSLTTYVARLNDFHVSRERPATCEWIVRGDAPALFQQYPPFVIQWSKRMNRGLCGFPQVTGGIRLSRLRKLFRYFAENKDSDASKLLLGGGRAEAYAGMLNRVVNNLKVADIKDSNWPDHAPSASLRGLATMIAAYISSGIPRGGDKIPVVKHLLFIMARTDFATMFKEIKPEEQEYYRKHPDQWVDFMCKDIMKKLPDVGAVDPKGKLIDFKIHDYGKLSEEQAITLPLTREEWLVGMTRGQDLFSAQAHPTKWYSKDKKYYKDSHGEHRLRGAGGLGDKMDHIAVGDLEKNAPVFEFRGPGFGENTMPYADWKSYALKTYRFLAAINIHSKKQKIDEEVLENMSLKPLFDGL